MDLQITDDAHTVVITIAGDITELADFSPVVRALEPPQQKSLHFVLGELRRFNSGGVGKWLDMIQQANARAVHIEFHQVNDAFLYQWILLPIFGGKGTVQSLTLSFVCEQCESAEQVAFTRQQHFPDGTPPTCSPPSCRHCGKTTALESVLDGLQL